MLPENPYDCDEFGHIWVYVMALEDGTRLFRCRECGEEREEQHG